MSDNSTRQRTVLPNWLLTPQHMFSISNSYKCRPSKWLQVPSSSIEHLCIILVPNCRPAYLFPCILFPFPSHPSADLPTFQINTDPPVRLQSIYVSSYCHCKCRPADLPIYSPEYFIYFLLIQVPICRLSRLIQVSVHLLYISASSKCWPVDMPTTSTRVAHNFPYSAKLFGGY